MTTAIIIGVLVSALIGFGAGLLVGQKNPKVAEKAVELSDKLK